VPGERLHRAVLAIHLVGAGEQLARRLLAQDIEVAVAARQQKGRVRGAALELLHMQRAVEALHVRAHPGSQAPLIETVSRHYVAD
jgi:predicted dinucleotide-binding enzyme